MEDITTPVPLKLPASERKTIGWREKIRLPQLGPDWIDAKIDTSARTSALHVKEIEPIEINGQAMVRFKMLDHAHPVWDGRQSLLPLVEKTVVRNSFGQEEERWVVKAVIRLHKMTFETEFTLSDRSQMEFPVLLGRKALRKRFIVDVARRDVYFKRYQKRST